MRCIFVSDLHGRRERYRKLFAVMVEERPDAVFLGGDLLPHGMASYSSFDGGHGFINDIMAAGLADVRNRLGEAYPQVYLILGNDDCRSEESDILAVQDDGLWHYMHNRQVELPPYRIYGYACVPPTPFRLKDWDRYDVSRHVDPGCIAPGEGLMTVPVPEHELKYATIKTDLERLVGDDSLDNAIFLFHSPPYKTKLDRAALDRQMIDHVPLDVHIGSIAIKRFIKARHPLLTLHGHVHESARLTGSWRDSIGRTACFSAAHDGPELALVRFDPADIGGAARELL